MLFRASAVGSHTTLSRIIRMVRRARSSKPEIGQLADKISAVFVPVVVVIALISAAIWYFFGPAPQIVYTTVIATTVLIIACPCALGLATPMSIISGVGRAAEFGVLVRDADALQRASTLDTVVFDKTGTLTEGEAAGVAVKHLLMLMKRRHCVWRRRWSKVPATRWHGRSSIKQVICSYRRSTVSAHCAGWV